MTTLKTIISAAAAVALVASPALAKSPARSQAPVLNVPYDARASVPYGVPYDARVPVLSPQRVHPYAADVPTGRQSSESNLNPDFQLGGER